MADWRPLDLLPGLYALALAGLLLAALRRWYDRLPARAAAVFALVLLPLLGPVLFGGKVLLPLDSLRAAPPFTGLPPADPPGNPQLDLVQQIAPTLAAVRRDLAAGRWPLRDPLVGAGIPLLADPQSQLLQPLVALALPLPLAQAAGVTAFLRLLVALVFTFLLLRRQGLGYGAALCGGLAYGLGGFMLLWLGWPIVNAAALLPLALYAVVRCDDVGGRADRLLLVLALFALLAAGHPEVTLYTGLLAAAFFLDRLRRRPRGGRAHLLAHGAAAAALAAGCAAPVLLPMADHLPQSERAEAVAVAFGPPGWRELRAELADPAARAAWAEVAGERLVPIAAPNAFGNSRLGAYWGEINSNDNSTGFAGSATLLLALLAVTAGAGRGGRRFPQERLVLGAVGLSLLLLCQPQGLAGVLHELPLLGATAAHRNRRLLVLVAFGLAYLAACTAERLRRGELARRRLLVAAGAALLGLVVAWAYVAHENPWWEAALGDFRRAWLWGQLAALAAAAGVLLAASGRRWGPAALAAIIAVELLAAHGPENPPMPKRLAFPAPPPVAYLQRHLGPGERMVALGFAFRPNLPSLYGLADVRAYNPFAPAAYRRLLHPLYRTPGQVIPELGRPRHALYDLLGVRFVLTRPDARLRWPLKQVHASPAGKVYARPAPLPLLFLPRETVAYPERYQESMLAPDRDFRRLAMVAPEPGRPLRWFASRPADSALELRRIEPARISARARLVEPRLLASSVHQDGNWFVVVAGERLPAVRANGPFVAAWLPSGASGASVAAGDLPVELLYRPRAFLAGGAAAALALALAAVWLLPPPRRR